MADMRRRSLEPPPQLPQIQFTPGLANEMLPRARAAAGRGSIDVNNLDIPDLDTLQQALNRAVERHNMIRFTPVRPDTRHREPMPSAARSATLRALPGRT